MSCKACPNGYYSNEKKASCLEIFRCGSGSYVKNVSEVLAEGRCAKCPPGSTQRWSETFRLDQVGSEVHPLNCFDCAVGKYQAEEGQIQCIDCPEGRFGNTTGGTTGSCTAVCPEGFYCSQSAEHPQPCPTGTVCPEGVAVPMPLLPGLSYRFERNETSGMLMIEQADCPKGKFRAVDANSIAAESTDSSQSIHTAGVPCVECPYGQYSDRVGAPYCLECKNNEYLHSAVAEMRTMPDYLVGMTEACIPCPNRLATCNGIEMGYRGHMWHAPTPLERHPTNATIAYTCALDGCPDRGEREMKCKEGYEGVLCATCSASYFKKISECVLCEEPDYPKTIVFCAVLLLLFPFVLWKLYRHRHVFEGTSAFTQMKIIISFTTILTTLNTQFG
jgi:hypothetical protein